MDYDQQFDAAEQRARERLQAGPHAVAAHYDRRVSRIVIGLSNGLELAYSPRRAEGLAGATALQLSAIEISPNGLGLHWPELDADLYVPALLQGVLGSPAWMAPFAVRGTATAPQPENRCKPKRRRTSAV